MDEKYIRDSEKERKLKELGDLEVEGKDFEGVPLDFMKDKEFIEKWGIQYDIDPDDDLDEDGHLKEE